MGGAKKKEKNSLYGNMGCQVSKKGIQNFGKKLTYSKEIPSCILKIVGVVSSCQKVKKFDFQSQFHKEKENSMILLCISKILESVTMTPEPDLPEKPCSPSKSQQLLGY